MMLFGILRETTPIPWGPQDLGVLWLSRFSYVLCHSLIPNSPMGITPGFEMLKTIMTLLMHL